MNPVMPVMNPPQKKRRLMDVGPATSFKLLSLFDSAGALSTNSTDMTVPQGTSLLIVRCVGYGTGGGSSDNGVGPFSGSCGSQRYVYYTGTSGGGFSKLNGFAVNVANPQLMQVGSNNGQGGVGVALNGTVICFAHGGTGTNNAVGDIKRGGGGGGSPGNGGGTGDHGCYGAAGSSGSGSYPCNYDGNNFTGSGPEQDQYGGDGGTAGDFGDKDGIGIGWSTTTGNRYTGVLGSRIVIHMYGYA